MKFQDSFWQFNCFHGNLLNLEVPLNWGYKEYGYTPQGKIQHMEVSHLNSVAKVYYIWYI